MTHTHDCLCRGSGWVCEDHPTRPYASETEVTCACDAPGQPCPGDRGELLLDLARDIAVAARRHVAILAARHMAAASGDPAAVHWLAGEILAVLPPEHPIDVAQRRAALDFAAGPAVRAAVGKAQRSAA